MNGEVMTLQEVSKYLAVHPMTVYRLINKKELPSFKVGGQHRFRKSLLDAFLDKSNNMNVRTIKALQRAHNGK
jgi:excisionase family DNA binding protein